MIEDIRLALCACAAVLSVGCASYTVPGRPADLSFLMTQQNMDAATDERPARELSLQEILERRPTLQFPTAIAVVRLQAPDYRSQSIDRVYGKGAFSVVTQRDVESDGSLQRLRDLPQVMGVATVNSLLVPERLDSDLDLRRIAAQLHADVLLLYTLDTTFELDDEIPPLTLLSLGGLPTQEAEVRTTASALLLDTRTGYLYGLAEGTAERSPHTSLWVSAEKIDDTRRETEREAFGKLVDEIANSWVGIVASYGGVVPSQ